MSDFSRVGKLAGGCFSAGAYRSSQALASRGLAGCQERARVFAFAAFLEPGPIRHVWVSGLPFGQSQQIVLRDPPFLRTVAEVSPLLSGQIFPLDLRHALTAENQIPKLLHHAILLLGIVVCKVFAELGKKSAFSTLRKRRTGWGLFRGLTGLPGANRCSWRSRPA
jgi:hypothetical protein